MFVLLMAKFSMNSIADQLLSPFPSAVPSGWLGFAPIPPGCYGVALLSPWVVTSNHADEVLRWQDESPFVNVLALDTGGLPLEEYLALYPFSWEMLAGYLQRIPANLKPISLRLPPALQQMLGPLPPFLGDQVILDSWDGVSSARVQIPEPLRPLLVMLRLASRQMLLWTIPLLVFGWKVMLSGWLMLLSGAILIGLGWKFFRFHLVWRIILPGMLLAMLSAAGAVLIGDISATQFSVLVLTAFLIVSWLNVLVRGAST